MTVLRAAACRVVIGLLSVVSLAAQQPSGAFQVERPVVPAAEGPQRLKVDVALLSRAQRFASVRLLGGPAARARGGLGDLRIFDSQGREVPYLLAHPVREPEWVGGAILPVAATKKTSGFEADFGAPALVDTLTLDGLPAPFLKRITVEGSGDRERWTMLAAEGTLFDLPADGLQQLGVAFRAGEYRYIRATWDDANSGRLPMPRAVRARLVPAVGFSHEPMTAPVSVERRPSEPGRSRYRLKLPAAGLPIVAVTLETGPGHVFRTAAIAESRLEGTHAAPVMLGRDTLVRVERDGLSASALRIPISLPREAELELVVDDGNNPPLDLKKVSVELAELPWIYFEAPGGPLTARYGNPSAAVPAYDLEAVREGLKLEDLPEAAWGEPVESSVAAVTTPSPPQDAQTGAAIDVKGFRHRRAIPATAGGLVALPFDAAALARSKGPAYAFADVRIADAAGRQVPYLLERRDEPLALALTLRQVETSVPALKTQPGHHRTVYAVTLPYPRLPSARLVLETSNRVFQRQVQVVVERSADRAHRDSWAELRAAVLWQHASQDTPAPAAVVPLSLGSEAELRIVVDEGDNQPLEIARARLLLPSWRARFYSPSQPLWLLYGHDTLPPPRYDLALLAPQVMGAEARELEAAADETADSPATRPLVTPRMFWVGLAGAVLALLAIIVKLVAGSSEAPPRPAQPGP
jgi:hypothetical protein